MRRPVTIVDCDPGWDDAIALVFALKSQRMSVLAITTVFGNASLNETTENARRITALCGRPELAVYSGSDAPLNKPGVDYDLLSRVLKSAVLEALPPDGVIGVQRADKFIIDAAQENAGELTIVALGPLTNVANALTRDAGLGSRISNIVIMGGALSSGNVTSYAEFNFFSDPEAASIALNAQIRKVIVPLETCAQLPITPQFITKLGRIKTKAASVLAKIAAERLSASVRGQLVPLYDVVAVLYALRPDIFRVEYGRVGIETRGSRRGALSFARNPGPSYAGVATDIDAVSAYSYLLEILRREPADITA